MARRGAWVKELRESGQEILVLDAGDLFFKKYSVPVPENESKGMAEKAQLIVESFNLMGAEAVAVGDDDLTLGKEFLTELSKKATFSFLCSNLLDDASGKTLFRSSLIKETRGLRIGMFGLLSPDFFASPSDSRKKGLNFRSPVETAQAMVRELKPRTDLIILLSHLGYAKDIELAQTVQGIHVIVGGHNGMNLSYPPALNTIIVQAGARGMFGGRLDLFLYNNQPIFHNSAKKASLENNLLHINHRLTSKETPEVEKAPLRKAKEEAERTLNQLRSGNQFTNRIIPLQEQMKEDSEMKNLIEAYKAKARTPEHPVSPK